MSLLAIYTLVHVAISLVGIGTGFVVFYNMLLGRESHRWTWIFLVTTILTSVTGFGFPATKVTPGHVFGVLSLIALSLAVYGKYWQHLTGGWRATYVATALFAQYLNVVVLIVQSFQKVPSLHALAPVGNEAPVLVVQLLTLAIFIFVGLRTVPRFGVPTKA
jgi:hypothetical protein